MAAGAGRRGRRRVDAQFLIAVVLLAGFAVLAVAGLLMRDEAAHVDVANALRPPDADHWFGTDNQGRDVFARVAAGTGIAFMCGTVVVLVAGSLGLGIALSCGLGPRWLDRILTRLIDAVMAFPDFLLALAIAMAFGGGLITGLMGIVVASVPIFARVLRAEAIRSNSETFVEAARTIGLSSPRLALRHVVPYLSTTMIVQAAAIFGNVIIILAGLSFIGMGAQPPTPEWGSMITEGMQNALTGEWWVGVFPGLTLLLTVIAVNLLADRVPAMRDSRRRPTVSR